MTSLRLRRAALADRVLQLLLDPGPCTLPRLLDLLHRESGGVDRIDEKDLVPVLSLLIEDGVIEVLVEDARVGKETRQQTYYMLRVT